MGIEKYKLIVNEVYEKLKSKPGNNVYILLNLLEKTRKIQGDIAEFGVYKGGTLACMALYLKKNKINKKIYGFDSFKGLPNYHENDLPDKFDALLRQGKITKEHYEKTKARLNELAKNPHLSITKFADASKEDVIKLLKELKLENVEIFNGKFSDTIKNLKTKLSFVFLDCDLYESYLTALNKCYLLMKKGGIIMLDEYYSLKYPGARIAVDEFFKFKKEKPGKIKFIPNDEFERWFIQF